MGHLRYKYGRKMSRRKKILFFVKSKLNLLFGVFEVADYENEVKINKFSKPKMADAIWWLKF